MTFDSGCSIHRDKLGMVLGEKVQALRNICKSINNEVSDCLLAHMGAVLEVRACDLRKAPLSLGDQGIVMQSLGRNQQSNGDTTFSQGYPACTRQRPLILSLTTRGVTRFCQWRSFTPIHALKPRWSGVDTGLAPMAVSLPP